MTAMDRTGWIGGVALLVCCAAAAAVLLGGSPQRADDAPGVGPGGVGFELTGQDEGLLDHHHANAVSSCTSVPAKWPDLLSGCQWYLSDSRPEVFDINVEPAWGATLGEGVTVLVVDSPVDYRHEDLRDNIDPADSPGLTEAAVTGSRTNHGTNMASIIAARDNAVGFRGVAPRAALTWRSINSATIHRDLALPPAECVEVVAADGSVAGAWAPGCESGPRSPAPARFFTFALDAPSRVTIEVRSSLDSMLFVRSGHAQWGTSIARDDDSGEGRNARVSRVFDAGVYTIEATTYARERSSGSFTLQVAGLDGQSAPEAIASERRWAPVWDSLLEAAVVNRSYSTANRTQPLAELRHLRVPAYEVYDTMAEFGFGGRGTLNVVAGGKTVDRTGLVFWSTLSEQRSHPAVVAVCATDRNGRRDARWNTSIEGPNLWVCAPLGGIVYANLGDRYFISKGTPSSPATALVSGVAALVRSIDANLSWRDVKLILAASAQHNDPDDAGWQHGAAVYGAAQQNYRYHHSYGFGIVDAGVAVQLARNWQYLPEYRSEHAPALSSAVTVPDDGSTVTADLAVDPEIDFVEYVEAHLVLDAPWFRDLEVELESPSGIVSTLSVPVGDVRAARWADYDCKQASECGISGSFRFGTAAHLGEDPAGMWTLRLADRRPNGGTNTLESWSLRFFGHKSSDPTPSLVPSPTFGPWPQVSIAAGTDIDEGGDATFTVTADPAPAAAMDVTVAVAQMDDPGVSRELRTVTVPASGTATLRVATATDGIYEPDGWVTATLRAVGGYTVSATAGTAAVAVADDVAVSAGDPCVVALSGDGPVSGAWAADCGSSVRSGRYARFYSFWSDGSGLVTIDLESWADSYLYLRAGSGQKSGAVLAFDDDGGDGHDSRISRRLAAGGYTIEATTVHASTARPFTLTMNGIPTPTAVRPRPEVSIAGGAGIVEGGDAVFTVTASPAPSAALDVTVNISRRGNFGVSPGNRTVTVPTSGSVTLSVATANDSADEADGSVTALLLDGSVYSVSQAASQASVAVSDDDAPSPGLCLVALSGDGPVSGVWASGCISSVNTGRFARFYSFSLDASSQVRVDLESSVDTYLYLRAGQGQMSGAVLESDDDGGDGYDSRISSTLAAGDYTIEATTYPLRRAGPFTLTVAGIGAQTAVQPDPEVSVAAGADIDEGDEATFTVTAVPAPSAALDVTVTVAQAGGFGVSPGSRTVTVPASGSATLTVATTNDSTDEPDGSVTATVAAGSGYRVSAAAGSASVAVADDDDPPPPSVCVPSLPSDAVTVSEVTGWRDGHSGSAHVLRWNRVLAALGIDSGTAPMTVEQSRANESQFMYSRWDRVTRTLEAIEQCDDPPPPPPPPDPEVSVTAGSGITEGADAAFTVTADPAPSAPLTVDVTVAQSGDFGVAAGARQVTIPTTGSVTLAVATANDSTDEADGSVTVTLDTGTGYTVSQTAAAATVAVADDDDSAPPPPPPTDPEISITAGSGITEGNDATFTVTADPAPAAPLTVDVTVAQSGDYGVAPGSYTVTVPTSGTATLTVATTDDSTDEPDGSITATIGAGTGYTVSTTAGTATVAVADDDNPPPPPPSSSKPSISVGDATAGEGDGAVEFTVRLSTASTAAVTVYYAANPGTAMPYADYLPDWGQITFAPGDTSKTVQVSLIDDRTPGEADETFVLKLILSDTTHATLADDQAQGTITDND